MLGAFILTWTLTVLATYWIRDHNFEVGRLRGNCEYDQRQYPEAISDFYRALKLQPGDPATHYLLATILNGQNDLAGAISHYLDAARNNPDFPEVLSDLAWIFATNPDPRLRMENAPCDWQNTPANSQNIATP